jgi:Recombination endonuclease VII
MNKPKTQAQLDRATDQRLIKKYGVGLGWYGAQLRLQNGGCAICGSTPKTRSLHIDHDHGWTKVKVAAQKIGKTWGASATYQGVLLGFTGTRRNEVVKLVKDRLKLMSVRGLLCFPHNAGLRKFSDNPKWMRAAAEYLEAHQGVK